MSEKERQILEAISNRFPSGRHSSRIILMLNGEVHYDRNEVINDLINIEYNGGSDKLYLTSEDREDAISFRKQLEEIDESEMNNW